MPAKSKKRRTAEPVLTRRLGRHFGGDSAQLPVVQHQFAAYERPNLHLAIEDLVHADRSSPTLIGILSHDDYHVPSLARLSRAASARNFDVGPVEYVDVALPGGRALACVKSGVYLVQTATAPLALLVTTVRHAYPPGIQVEVMAEKREDAETFLRELQMLTNQGKAYRGHVLSVEQDCHGAISIQHHKLPRIDRADVILPDALLQRIERHTLSFSKHAERLRAARRHLKRGILLHGPPGTGKTLTAMYLVAQMPGRTVLIMTGGSIQAIEAACRLARLLEPTTVVLEDVDLIGTERGYQTVGANALLFELLNQMDGLAEDADILFVLTTNRPDVLEPALAARPGRIDQAIQVPPPDAECRRRLFELYAQGLHVEIADWPRLIERTQGVSGAFIRELLRKAAMYAAEENGAAELTVSDRHLEEGLAELLVAGGPLTQTLLGASGATG